MTRSLCALCALMLLICASLVGCTAEKTEKPVADTPAPDAATQLSVH